MKAIRQVRERERESDDDVNNDRAKTKWRKYGIEQTGGYDESEHKEDSKGDYESKDKQVG
jgi:hypothetical protein